MSHVIASAYTAEGGTIFRCSYPTSQEAVDDLGRELFLSGDQRAELTRHLVVQYSDGYATIGECSCDRPEKHMKVQRAPNP